MIAYNNQLLLLVGMEPVHEDVSSHPTGEFKSGNRNIGNIWLQEGMGELIEEFLYYPRGKFRDGLDALAQGPTMWGTTWDEQALAELEEIEERIVGRIGPDGYSFRYGPRPKVRVRGGVPDRVARLRESRIEA